MKRHLLTYLIIYLFAAGCSYEMPVDYEKTDFTVADAKNYFEKNAADLQNVNFAPKSKAATSARVNITPDWKAAKITQTGKITTVEIPLDGDVCKMAQISRLSSMNKLYGFVTGATTRLIVQNHKANGTSRQFVATLIDHPFQNYQTDKTRNYYGKSNYSGYIIISAVTGEYLESFRSTNGKWRRVYMLPGGKEDLEDPQNESLNLHLAKKASVTYQLGEGSSTCVNCGNPLSMCTCCKHCNGEGCSECMVTVYPTCPKCQYTGPGALSGSCYCCPWCHNYPCTCNDSDLCPYCLSDPCVCNSYKCIYCGSRYCPGNCQEGGGSTNPDPSPDQCPHNQCPICHKMIRTLTRSSSCDYHEYCENDGKCVDVRVSVSKNTITLGDSYTITLHLNPASTVCYDITYYIVKDGQEFILPREDLSTTLTTMARSPGDFRIKAEIMQDGTYKTFPSKNEEAVKHEFPHRDTILQQQVVRDGINQSWAQTLAAADAEGIQEFGGVVMINTMSDYTGDLYQYKSAEGKKTPYENDVVSVVLTDDENISKPNQGGRYTVLLFHTHPPYWEYTGNTKYERKVGSSDIDKKNHTTLPAVVMDFQHKTGSIHSLMPKADYVNTEKLYYYGIDRRIN